MIKRTLGSIILSNILVLGLNSNALAQNFEYKKSIDGSSRVLVIEQPNSGFTFYRDSNGDGFADSKGTGFYWMGISKSFEEEKLPENKYSFEEIEMNLKGDKK